MESSISAGTTANTQPVPTRSRPRRAKRKRRMRPGTRYALIFAVLVAFAILAQFAVHMARTNPRDARTIAERELRVNTLAPDENVYRSVPVFQRPAIDYFRATRGLLVLTNKRLLYLGLQPRDLLAAPDMPPTFVERDFPIDTLVQLGAGRTFFGLAHAIVIRTPSSRLKLGVPADAWPKGKLMIIAMDVRHDRAVAEGVRQRKLRAMAEAERKAAEAEAAKPRFYTVRRGDALGSIATMWNTTTDRLRAWNHLPDSRRTGVDGEAADLTLDWPAGPLSHAAHARRAEEPGRLLSQ